MRQPRFLAWLPMLFSTATFVLFAVYRSYVQSGAATSPNLLESARQAVETGVKVASQELSSLPYYYAWIAAMYVHACLAVAVATAAVYVAYVVCRSWTAARFETEAGARRKLLDLGATRLTILVSALAYGAFFLIQWCSPERALFSSVVLRLSRDSQQIDAAFPAWGLCKLQALLAYPAASLGATAACLSLTLLRKPASALKLDDLKSCADHLRLLRVLTVGMLVAASLATGLWFQWPAMLVKQPHAGTILGLGAGATILASALYTAGVAAVYLPAEYILRLRVKAWLCVSAQAKPTPPPGPVTRVEQATQLTGLPIGSMLESYREALSVLTPLIVGVAQALLTTR